MDTIKEEEFTIKPDNQIDNFSNFNKNIQQNEQMICNNEKKDNLRITEMQNDDLILQYRNT